MTAEAGKVLTGVEALVAGTLDLATCSLATTWMLGDALVRRDGRKMARDCAILRSRFPHDNDPHQRSSAGSGREGFEA